MTNQRPLPTFDVWTSRFLTLASAFVLAVVLALAFVAQPSADDYCFGEAARVDGIWGALRSFYETHGVAYSSWLLLLSLASSPDSLRGGVGSPQWS